MIPCDWKHFSDEDFRRLPLVIEGESKEVRYLGRGLVLIKLKPTIYSFTANRCEVVPNSDSLRLEATRIFWHHLRAHGLPHVYREIGEKYILAELVLPTEAEFQKYAQPVFVPTDVDLKTIKKAPPIEVVLKRFHGGTSKHRYKFMDGAKVRDSHQLFGWMEIHNEQPYPELIVRFDWRNPFEFNGQRVADEILPEDLADYFIDVKAAKSLAIRTYDCLSEFLDRCDIVCNDLCLFIDESGTTLYGEISQDCGRFRHFDLGSLDKDVWRAGGSSQDVLAKWQLLIDLMRGQGG